LFVDLSFGLSINGGTGRNTLDYSVFTGDVTVDLPLGFATGLSSITNIQNVTGSIGNDILVGDGNANVLRGGTGRNLIIGGGGADQLFGGGGDNILIGGTTNYDRNLAALDAIMALWTQPNMSYQDRVNYLSGQPDPSGQTFADPLNAGTVSAGNPSESLTGGPQNNWIFR
jgi:Ca2+-binding RTX toxin-like protein